MLEFDTIRGPHSTGIFAVKSDKSTMLVKGLGTPWDLYETKPCEKLFQAVVKVLIGHNRWATKGRINKANAHPFEFETLAGAHNGTLNSVYQLDDYTDFEVDSENLYHHMDKNGVEDTIKNLNGAFALTWYSKTDHTINLIRNHERPLYYALTEDMKTLMWASEDWMLAVACHQAGIKHKPIQSLPVGVWYSFDIPEPNKEFEKARARTMEMYVSPWLKEGSNKVVEIRPKSNVGKTKKYFSDYQKYVGSQVLFSVSGPGVSLSGQSFIEATSVIDEDIIFRMYPQKDSEMWKTLMTSPNYFTGLAKSYNSMDGGYATIDLRTISEIEVDQGDIPEEPIVGFEGEELDEEEFHKRTNKGCAWCASPVEVACANELAWIAKEDFICPDCAEQPEVKTYLTK